MRVRLKIDFPPEAKTEKAKIAMEAVDKLAGVELELPRVLAGSVGEVIEESGDLLLVDFDGVELVLFKHAVEEADY